jgi:hypothetical protein
MTKNATMTTKRKTASAFDASEGPGLARLRKAKNAEAIREATLADQKRARRKARAEKAPGKQIGLDMGRTETALPRPPQSLVERSSIEKPAVGTKVIGFVQVKVAHLLRGRLPAGGSDSMIAA